MLRKLVLAVTVALVATVLSPLAAAQGGGAGGGGRAFRSQPIRAGVIINPRATNNASAAPFAWYNLDNATGVKPAEWTFVNPNNEGTMSQATFNRWRGIDSAGFSGAGIDQAKVDQGLRIQKRYASYWEVDLTTASDSDMAQYDVLLFAPLENVSLTPAERGKLSRFVDGGGVLWIDYDPLASDPLGPDSANSFPIPFRTISLAPPYSGVQSDPFHPIFTQPLTISGGDQDRLAIHWDRNLTYGPSAFGIEPISGLDPAYSNALQTLPAAGDYARLRPVSQFAKGGNYYPTAMVGKIGDGYEVITVRQVAQKLNRTAANGDITNNRKFLAQAPKLFPDGTSAAKFAVNIVSLVSSAPQFGGGSRKLSALGADIGAPLLARYTANYQVNGADAPLTVATDPVNLRPPVIYKGLVVVTQDDIVSVYDADPARDADGDGDPDDGVIDYSVGSARDLIFQTRSFGGTISSASVAEVIDAGGNAPRDQLIVMDETGKTAIFPIYGNVVSGRRQWLRGVTDRVDPEPATPIGTGTDPAATPLTAEGPKLFSPTVYGSFAYVVDAELVSGNQVGRLRALDLRTGQALASTAGGRTFVAGGSGGPIPPPAGSATVGQIPILDNSGGSDVVAYVPVQTASGTTASGPGIVSFWIGAKGEKPFSIDYAPNGVGGGELQINTRAASQGGLPIYTPAGPSPLGVRITILQNGVPIPAANYGNVLDGQPNLSGLDGVIKQAVKVWDDSYDLRVDYTIDWGLATQQGKAASIERGRMTFSDVQGASATARRILGGIALGPQGTLFATVGTQRSGSLGTVYALKEEGRGAFRMTWRWDLYPRHTFPYEGGQTTVEAALPDNDPIQYLRFGGFSLANIFGGRFTNTSIQGAPVVRGNKVFVTVAGNKAAAGAVPSSAILCFSAEPPEPEIRTDLDLSGGFAIVQPDFTRSADPTFPRTPSLLSSNGGGNESVSFDKAANGVGGVIRFSSLAGVRNGQVADSISLSLPVIIRRPGQTDALVDPNEQGNRWSPLQWYTILHGTQLYGPAFASGNTLYVSGSSITPQFLIDGVNGAPTTVDGVINAIRTDVETTNALTTTARAAQAGFTSPSPAVGTDTFETQRVILDAARPWMRQVLTLDYPRRQGFSTPARWDDPQAYNDPASQGDRLYGNPYFVFPQNPRNIENRGKLTFEDYRTRLLQSIIPGSRRPFTGGYSSYGIVGGDRTLVTWNQNATSAFTRSEFWVADEGRIAKIDPSGNVLFDSRASLRQGVTGASGAANVLPLVRPTRVVPIAGDDDLLVVDTGANRILRMDSGGTVSRELAGFAIDSAFVPNGFRNNDPLTFKNPRDATTFSTRVLAADNKLSNPSPAEEWIHTLIADEGNNRLVELVDRIAIDPTTYERLNVVGTPATLWWTSPAQVSGKGYDYVSVSRVRIPDKTAGTARYAYVAGLGNFSPGRQDAGEVPPADGGETATPPPDGRDAVGGGIVVFDPQLPAGVAVYSSIEIPEIDNVHRWNDRLAPTGTFADVAGLNSEDDYWRNDGAILPAQSFGTNNAKRLAGVSSVTASVVVENVNGVATPVIAVMVADRTGVYEVYPVPAATPTDPNRTVLSTRWMITDEAFRAMRRVSAGVGQERILADSPDHLRATYARRLDDENVLMVNGYVGKTRGLYGAAGNVITAPSVFNGEVLQIDGRLDLRTASNAHGNISNGYSVQNDNLGFGSRSVKVRFGTIEGARGILQPVFADRR